METKPEPKMIRIKLPKQRIVSLNACNNSKLLKPVAVKKMPIMITNKNIKLSKTIDKESVADNNVCYFEVFDRVPGKNNSASNIPTGRVYVTPPNPIKNVEYTNKSFEVQNLRVYTDSHKKEINTNTKESKKKYEGEKCDNILIQRIMNQSKVNKEINEKIIHTAPHKQFEYNTQQNNSTQNKEDVVHIIKSQQELYIDDQNYVENNEYDIQYKCDLHIKEEIQNKTEIEKDFRPINENETNERYEINEPIIKTEPQANEQMTIPHQDFEETMDTFFISNKRADNMFAKKGNEYIDADNVTTLDHMQNNITEYENNNNNVQESVQITDQNLFQIVTENGTLLLHNNTLVQELIKNGQLIINNGEQDETQEVVLCDGEPLEGTEYVLEYANDVRQETVETISCNSCGEEFQNLEAFEIHQPSHKGNKSNITLLPAPETYLCYCGLQFEDINEFETHQNKHKTNFKIPVTTYNQKYKCNLCSKMFISQNILDNHMISHKAKLSKRKKLYKREQPSEEPLLCDICSKQFKYKSALKVHKKRHTDGKKYECEICKKLFSQRVSLRKHSFTHINPVTCSHCDLIFRDKDVFEFHKIDAVCPMETAKEMVQRWKQEAILDTSIIGYVCAVCNTFVDTEEELENHIMTSHILDSTTLFCFECGQKASSKEDLQAHIVTHTQVYHKRILCNVCGIVCESQASLIVHQRVHTNERPFKCPQCPHNFKTKIHMQSHLLVHTKEKKFECPVCNKYFALKGNMQAHLRGHTGEKPYVCPICREAFKDTKYLKKHKLMYHADEDMPWGQYLKVSKTRPCNLALTRAHDILQDNSN